MTVPQRLAAFAVAVGLAFVAGLGLGGAVDPVLDDEAPAHQPSHEPGPDRAPTSTTAVDHEEHGP